MTKKIQKPNQNSAEKLVPKVRFPEFENDGEWKKKPFSKLFKIGSGRDYKHLDKGEIPVYGTGGYMLSVNDYLYDGKSACIGRKGTINKPIFLTGKFWTVDTLFYTHSFKDCSPEFIYLLFQNINWLNYNEAGGVPSLSKIIIHKIEVYVPSPKEQERIIEVFTSLDNIITAATEKLDYLKDHKKGLLQNLFPTNSITNEQLPITNETNRNSKFVIRNSKQPQFRFPEFKNDGDWEEKELSVALDGKSSQIAKNKLSFIKKGYPVYGADGMLGFIDSYAQEDDYIAIVKDGSGVGNLFYHQGQSSLLGTLNYLFSKDDEKYILKWLYYLLQTISFRPFIKGSGIPHIYYKDYSKLLVLIPKNPKEQQKIANCLSSVDDLIETQEIKIKALKKHKKGLMQQLFPNVITN